jgi:hypothetical protein
VTSARLSAETQAEKMEAEAAELEQQVEIWLSSMHQEERAAYLSAQSEVRAVLPKAHVRCCGSKDDRATSPTCVLLASQGQGLRSTG